MINKENVYIEKAAFVRDHLSPLLVALDVKIVGAEYRMTKTGNFVTDEVIEVTYESGRKAIANVLWDSKQGMVKDVVKQVLED